MRRQPSNEQVIKVYKAAGFHKGKTAKALGISRSSLYRLLTTREELAKMVHDAEEEKLDNAEKVLGELVEDKNFQAVKFILETKGRKRGYGSSLELTGDASKPITLITSRMSPEDAERAYRDTIRPDVDDL